jgi:hypothetical protein
MKFTSSLAILAVIPLAFTAPVDYGSYGDYPAPAGGYGSYGDVPTPSPPPPPAGGYGDYPAPAGGYGSYPAPAGGYGGYGAYKRAVEFVKSLFG